MRDNPTAVMLFAAGFGTRMGALTATHPKPLVQVSGTALIDHTLSWVHQTHIEKIVVNTHYRSAQIVDHLAGSDALISHESPDILETGGGLRAALPLLGDGPVFTSNTDAIWKGPNPFETLLAAWDPDIMDALLLCVPPENALGHKGHGDFLIGDDGQLTRGPGLVFGGVQIIKTSGLAAIPEKAFSLNVLWNRLQPKGKLFGIAYSGQWCDVGSPQGLEMAETLLGKNDV